MTDGDNLALAYLRQEFQINPQQARLLWALWTANARHTVADLATRSHMSENCVRVAMSALRPVLAARSILIEPPVWTARAGRWRTVRFYLADHARAEISRLLTSAADDLLNTIRPHTKAA